jgi:Sulfotransferase family
VPRTPSSPILVTGSHRSGTTWVGRTIARAPGIGYLDEPLRPNHRPGVFAADVPYWFPYIAEGTDGDIVRDVRRTLAFRYGYRRELGALRTPRDAARFVRDAARFGRRRLRGDRPLWKDPLAILSVPWLAGTFGMDVVVMIRHPAAFASSLKRMGWTHDFSDFTAQPHLVDDLVPELAEQIGAYAARPPDVVDQAVLLWVIIHSVIARYRVTHPEWIYLRHEDVSRSPEAEFRRVFDRLDVEFTAPVERYIMQTTSASNPADAPSGVAHQLRRDSAANVETWRARLEPDEIRRVRAGTEQLAAQFYPGDTW